MTGLQPDFRIDDMKPRIWNRPLPERFLLGGEQHFSSDLLLSNQAWILGRTSDKTPLPAVEFMPETPGMKFQFFLQFNEHSQSQSDPLHFNPIPKLKRFSWDWIEFSYQVLKDLEIRSFYWAPDSGVICGESWIYNLTDKKRLVAIDLICLLQSQGAGNQIFLDNMNGRPVLTGCLGDKHLVLFLAGNPIATEDPFPYLQNEIILSPYSENKVHWICAISDTRKTAQELLESVLQLDWSGETSRRKIAHQSQIEITTGDPDWDIILALSQKQAQLIYHQITSRENLKTPHGVDLTPIQALMLLQSLENQTPDKVKKILDLVFKQSNQSKLEGRFPDHDPTPPILAGELLWQIYQSGFIYEIWSHYLPFAAGWLDDWLSPDLDKDGDGIPELTHPWILDLAGSNTTVDMLSGGSFIPYPYLESPGLGALLYNDVCKIDDLAQVSGCNSDYHFLEEKETFLNFLQESWNPDKGEYQNRDSRSHAAVNGFNILDELQSGLNIIRADFPQPARIGIIHHRSAADRVPGEFRVICHGLNWQGNYRIEELSSTNFTWGEKSDLGISESIYSKLDYCILKGEGQKGKFSLVVPTTVNKDITQLLPFWAGIVPDDQTGDIIENLLLDPDRHWSPYGFSSSPDTGEPTTQLFWNLLLGQSLQQHGRSELAAEMIGRWMAVIIPAFERSGCTFPGYGVKTGQGIGLKDSLESLFPVRFFLQVLGVEFFHDGRLIITGKNPFPWPVTLKYRGLEIIRESGKTTIIRPGKEILILTDPDLFQLDLD